MLQLSVTSPFQRERVGSGLDIQPETIPHLSPLGAPPGRDPEREAKYERAMALAICKPAPLSDD